MPELPEVEIVKQSLNKSITGKIIRNILIKNRNLRFKIPKFFEKKIIKKKIIKVDRFSKHLILKFEDSSNLMIRRPPRSTQSRSSAASDVYKRQAYEFQRT